MQLKYYLSDEIGFGGVPKGVVVLGELGQFIGFEVGVQNVFDDEISIRELLHVPHVNAPLVVVDHFDLDFEFLLFVIRVFCVVLKDVGQFGLEVNIPL